MPAMKAGDSKGGGLEVLFDVMTHTLGGSVITKTLY